MKTLLLSLLSLTLLLSSVYAQSNAFSDATPDVALAVAGGGDFVTNVSVYPNPSSTGNFTVAFIAAENTGRITVRVYSLIGREVFYDEARAGEEYRTAVSIGDLPKGIYMLEITNGAQKQVRRISFI